MPRITSVEEIRPEEAINSGAADEESEPRGNSPQSPENRHHIESSEQAFFNQRGFVTDSRGFESGESVRKLEW